MTEVISPMSTELHVNGLPSVRGAQYAVSVLTADASPGAVKLIQETAISTVQADGKSHLPHLHGTVDTLFTVSVRLPARLQAGDLLVVDQASSRVMVLRDGVARPYLEVSSWCDAHLWDTAVNSDLSRVYLSLSGMRGPNANHVGIAGTSAILEIDTATGRLTKAFTAYDEETGLPYADRMVDLAGLVVTPDDRRVLACDFNNWQGDGKVVAADLETGRVSVLADGLDQPSSLSLDGPDHVLVANTRQPHGKASGGQIVRIGIQDGTKETLADITGVDASLIGVVRLADGSFAAALSEGTQEKCVLVHVPAGGGAPREIWHPRPGFIGSGISTDGHSIWVAETLRRRVYAVTADGSVERHFQVYDAPAEGELEFMFRGFDTLESVRLVGRN
ncbi:hypothetical protein [Actinomadura chibensis]|uniref:Lactonase family protein n=1 Tax=Actinomadura chibensis TaxID=392828 RepID=A0A5D0NXL4_9ACTN|nr:hypothetical protein [Actinomadura chibensis]TYB49022.1 hypothetical protein FXF69_07720 [Actinomadura chibensis]